MWVNDNLDRFHIFDEKGRAKGVYDHAILEYFITEQHIFVLGGVPYIYQDGCYHADGNGSKLKTMIRDTRGIKPIALKQNAKPKQNPIFSNR